VKISKKGLEVIKKHEGFRNKPYLCPAGIPTIGYGNTYYPDGSKVKMTDKPLSKDIAYVLLRLVVEDFEQCVNKYVKSDINQNQFDALVSFAYNLGCGNLKKSTLLKKVNANPCDITISNEFAKWDKAGGRRLRGLTIRRHDEAVLYFTDI
jgi:lysozyme